MVDGLICSEMYYSTKAECTEKQMNAPYRKCSTVWKVFVNIMHTVTSF